MEHTAKAEQQRLAEVLEKLDSEIKELNLQLGEKQQEIVKMKKYFWENCNEFDELGYEHYTNRQMIQSEINMAEDRMKKRQSYERLRMSPYFACVDFRYEGETAAEPYYIGLASFRPKKSFMPLVYDWRAPISGLFYDYDKGPAGFFSPQGEIKGEILHKLQYKITNGMMEFFFENDMKIDDDILMRELGNNANARLKSIVATIQREQNAIIRNEKDRILVVQGAAGSGKTSVALHRIAYLLYHKRQELNSDNVMILSPNPIFSDYISQILPELGEEQILEMSFDEYAKRELRGIANFESRYRQMEYLLTSAFDSKTAAHKRRLIEYKQSREFLEEMYGYVLQLEEDFVEWKDLDCKNIKRESSEMELLFYEKFPDVPILQRLDVIADYIISEQESIDKKDMDPIRAEIVRDRITSMYRTKDIRAVYYDFLQTLSDKTQEQKGHSEFTASEAMIPYEDVYPLIYFRCLLCGTRDHRNVRHLVIDEMQDYNRIQYAVIEKLFHCPMTILGDREQATDGRASEVLRILPEIFGRQVKLLELRKSYRSTYEIGTFSSQFTDSKDTEFFQRHGKEPKLHRFSDGEELLQELARRIKEQLLEYSTIAVITITQKEADRVYRSMKDRVGAVLFGENSDTFITGVVVAPFYLVKGLEFDTVHVVNVNAESFYAPIHRQALYIACTRALHELDLYHTGTKSPLIRDIN